MSGEMTAANDRPVVFLASKFRPELVSALGQRYTLLGPMGKPLPEAVAALPAADASSVRAVLTLGTIGIDRAAMGRLPSLGLVCCLGSGYEGVDLAAAKDRGIVVAHSPGANASSVADVAMGLLITSVRRMFSANAFLLSGDWERRVKRSFIGPGLTGRRMGIFGLGQIGERIALRAAAFEMEIGYFNRRQRTNVPYTYFPSLLSLAEWADVLMIAVRADAGNRHAVDAEVLRVLGANGHVINISRGSMIDEDALVDALQRGVIAGAGLDVFESEPVVPEALRALKQVALVPHIGSETDEAVAAMSTMVLANLEAFFAGRAVPTPVPSEALR